MVTNGADVNKRGLWKFLPIQVAAEFNSNEIVDYLIENGAVVPVLQNSESYQLLHAACSKGLTKLFEKMMSNGFDFQNGRYTSTLLHEAAAGGSPVIIDAILSKGYKVMSGDGYGWSPLHCAAERGNLDAVKLLAGKGADINDRTISGNTAYNLAENNGLSDICKFLKSAGADTSE